jgi:hypothetical protein
MLFVGGMIIIPPANSINNMLRVGAEVTIKLIAKTQRPASAHRRKELPMTDHLAGCNHLAGYRASGNWDNGLEWGRPGSGPRTKRGTAYKLGLSSKPSDRDGWRAGVDWGWGAGCAQLPPC